MIKIPKVVKTIENKLDKNTIEVIRKSSKSLVIKLLGLSVGFWVSIVLGRQIGPEGLGVINLANRTVGILLVLSMFGMENVILKEVAIGFSKSDWKHVNSIVNTSLKFNGTLAVIITSIILISIPYLISEIFHEPELMWPLTIATVAMVPQVISRIYGASLIGYKKIWQSNLVNETLSIWVVGVALLLYIVIEKKITVVDVAWFYAVGRVCVTLSVFSYWNSIKHTSKENNTKLRPMMKMALPLLLVNSTGIIAASADTVMLGWLSEVKEVGLYSVAVRLALLTSFFLQVSNSAISPKLASLYAQGRSSQIEIMVQRVSIGLFVIASIILLFFLVLGRFTLSLWGADFIDSYYILIVLTIGQFINLSTGPVGFLLMMCNQEKTLSRISIFSLALNLSLNYILIRLWGAIGAAIATSISIIFENITKVIFVKKKLGISIFNINVFLK